LNYLYHLTHFRFNVNSNIIYMIGSKQISIRDEYSTNFCSLISVWAMSGKAAFNCEPGCSSPNWNLAVLVSFGEKSFPPKTTEWLVWPNLWKHI